MRLNYRVWRGTVLLAGALLLVACSAELFAPPTTAERLLAYETSLRSEADWLWNNMNYARLHYEPDPVWCSQQRFDHQPVTLSRTERDQDPDNALLSDHLEYAAARIAEVRAEWERYCRSGGGHPGDYMEAGLRLAYSSLNTARVALRPRQPTPQAGST